MDKGSLTSLALALFGLLVSWAVWVSVSIFKHTQEIALVQQEIKVLCEVKEVLDDIRVNSESATTTEVATRGLVSELTRQRILTLYPGIRPTVYRVLRDVELSTSRPVNVTEALRNMDHQLALYAQGRELVHGAWRIKDMHKIVTNAKPGLSFHNYGLAFDVACAGSDPYLAKLKPSEQDSFWNTYGAVAKKWGLKWGGDFKLANGVRDLPHAEQPYGLCISNCVELYERGGLKGVWAYLDQLRGVPIGTDWEMQSG